MSTAYGRFTFTIANGTALSEARDFGFYVGDAGVVLMPGTWTAANLGFKVCDTENGTYAPLRDEAGAIVEISGIQTGAPGAYKLPAALRGARWVRMWSQSAGSDANQAGERAIVVHVKG
jgi:hypothetical protein